MYRNLVLKGGGPVGCIAHCGAAKVLEDNGILKNITNFAGTSAGSIIAELLRLGYNSSQLNDIISSLDFSKFKDGWNPLRFFTHYGIYKGDYFLNYIRGLTKNKTGNENTTFKEMTGLDIIATKLSTRGIKIFNSDTSPDVQIASAVRASMSIPGFFQAFEIDGELYIDGGLIDNYPLNIFDKNSTLNPETLGVSIFDYKGGSYEKISYYHWIKFIKAFVDIASSAATILENVNKENDFRGIKIDRLGISSLDFSPPKELIYNSGMKYTAEFLATIANI
jgi:NTE family protein